MEEDNKREIMETIWDSVYYYNGKFCCVINPTDTSNGFKEE